MFVVVGFFFENLRSVETAISAISDIGCEIVERVGEVSFETKVPSNPITFTSSGTLLPFLIMH